jgi:hypothetical protein
VLFCEDSVGRVMVSLTYTRFRRFDGWDGFSSDVPRMVEAKMIRAASFMMRRSITTRDMRSMCDRRTEVFIHFLAGSA